MPHQKITASDAHSLNSGFAQAVAVDGPHRTVFVSGQIGLRPDGSLPEDFEGQARQVWANIEAQLRAAGMGLGDIVHHRTFLSDRQYADALRSVRNDILGPDGPALTVVIAEIFDAAWLLEIEAVAAR